MMPTKNNNLNVAGAANAPAVGGNASIEDVLKALSPAEAAQVQQGIDPFGYDQVPMESLPQVGMPQAGTPMPQVNPAAPNALDTINMLQQILGTIPQDSQMGAVAAGSIQTAIDALGAGAQGAQQPMIR